MVKVTISQVRSEVEKGEGNQTSESTEKTGTTILMEKSAMTGNLAILLSKLTMYMGTTTSATSVAMFMIPIYNCNAR